MLEIQKASLDVGDDPGFRIPGPTRDSSGEPIRVLIADDEPLVLSLLSDLFGELDDCRVELASTGEEALDKFRRDQPDLLITDLKMPCLSGEDLTRHALEARPDLTVLVITGNGTVDNAVRMMKEGVFDYITKPFQLTDFTASVERAVQRIRGADDLKEDQAPIASLLNALEAKDPYLKHHSSRVARLAHKLGLSLGLSPRQARSIRRAALAHDLGKIGVPDEILSKPGPLSRDEFSEIRKHPARSVRIVQPLVEFQECLKEIYHHHEWYNGTGYPEGVSGGAIPLGGRIITVCDAYDAMASHRAYRLALSDEVIRENLLSHRGSQFDGDVVDMFLRVFTR